MFDIYTAVILMTFLLLVTTVVDATTNRLVTRATKIRTIIVCATIAISAIGECVGVLTNGADASLIWLHKLAKVVEFVFAPFIGIFAAFAYGATKRRKLVLGLAGAHGLFQIVALFFGLVFTVDSQNVYHREEFYFVYVAAFVLSVVYGFACIIRNGKEYQIGFDAVLALTLMILVVGIGIQFVWSEVRIDYLCIAIGNELLYTRYYKVMLQVDAVTGLLNRKCYDVNVADIGTDAVVIIFDVDKFKNVNDAYGHSKGDACLQRITLQLRNVYGKYGLCYRIGGDEFCAILKKDGVAKVEELNEAFLEAIDELRKDDDTMPGVTIGYAFYNAGNSHIQSVIEEADAMLYRNKNS